MSTPVMPTPPASPAAPPGAPSLPGTRGVMFDLSPEDRPRVETLVTEDGAPVDSIYSERQMRLLTDPLYASWGGPGPGRPFVAMVNVGMFYNINEPPLVPDVLVSLDVQPPTDVRAKQHRSYFFWEYRKPPDVVVEIVSNTEGGEDGHKKLLYAQVGVLYYVIWDPDLYLKAEPLRCFTLRDRAYVPHDPSWLPGVGLGLTRWQGMFEGFDWPWLRWCDQNGQVLLTALERAEQERQRAERLAAQLRAAGIEPEA